MNKPRTIVLVGDARKERSAAAIAAHETWLRRRFRVVLRDLDGSADLSRAKADLIVLFGGDGSILSVARRLAGNAIPVLGVNTGRLGFLAEVPLDSFRSSMEHLGKSPLRTSDRMMFEVEVAGPGGKKRLLALNDAVIARGSVSRMVHLRLTVGEEPFTLVSGDGLILATPSGSTAHSMAAGGPIVFPELEAMIITPICPHSLSMRPIVLPAHRAVGVELVRRNGDVMLTVDGQEVLPIGEGDAVTVRRAKKPFRLVHPGPGAWFAALRDKMGFAGALTPKLP
ncbi:MAG: NAD(+)/NADH kinase [Planctomycetes bacterium]|nr:NAD(+)/NADH kinase [Planctomycetota bacterium]